jgi:hypothetical protein
MDNIVISYGHLVYFLRPFGKVVVIWYIFSRFGKKNLATLSVVQARAGWPDEFVKLTT